MPSPHQATVSATLGPGKTLSGAVLRGMTQLHVDAEKKTLEIVFANTVQQFELTSATSISISISSGVYTATIS